MASTAKSTKAKPSSSPATTSQPAWHTQYAQYKIHPAADLFPLLEGKEFDELAADIERYGLREPIVKTSDGKILDGRNRLRGCLAKSVEPRFITFRGPGTAIQYVISANLHRRHLTTSQRALIAAKIAKLQQGARTDLAENSAMSQPEAAEALNVSRGSTQLAKKILDTGTPELVEAVRDGTISVGAASAATELEPEAQREVVKKVKRGVKASTAVPKKTKTAAVTTDDDDDDDTPKDPAKRLWWAEVNARLEEWVFWLDEEFEEWPQSEKEKWPLEPLPTDDYAWERERRLLQSCVVLQKFLTDLDRHIWDHRSRDDEDEESSGASR